MTNLNGMAVALVFSAGAMAASMSKDSYNAGKAAIAAEYNSARMSCNAFTGNAKDVCMVTARGQANVATAELKAGYQPAHQTRYNVNIAKTQAEYSVSVEKCDDKAGNDKDVCIKVAKAAKQGGDADARALLKTANSG